MSDENGTPPVRKYVCLHGHFYQPPRENPWLEEIELQDSAYPYHDWNERVDAECYGPNGAARILDDQGRITHIVNNYARISFNFGPTLLSWMEAHAPKTYGAIQEADRRSIERFGGHGSAIAQTYNHTILPLSSARDKRTQVSWGVRDFEHRFGRKPEGMWLPETAVDVESLELLVEHGITYTILTPYQAARVRPVGEVEWSDVPEAGVDPGLRYRVPLPSGRSIDVFFYDGPVARAVAFERLLESGDRLFRRIIDTFPEDLSHDRLAHIATDGETYGHHHRFGEMALAFALQRFETTTDVRLTNYGAYRATHPVTHEVEIRENTAWSCAHGLGRWRTDCGCQTGAHPDWNQRWREPLREALDLVRDRIAPRFETAGAELLHDPWRARDDYIEVVLDRSKDNVDRFVARHAKREPSAAERRRILELMELQRHAMLMYTSCGWFFDDVTGIETVQVLRYAERVLQLAATLFGEDMEPGFLEILERAPSNLRDDLTGRTVYEDVVRPVQVDLLKVCSHYSVAALFEEQGKRSELFGYVVERSDFRILETGLVRLALGRANVVHSITGETADLSTAAIHLGDHNIVAGAVDWGGDEAHQAIMSDIEEAFSRADYPEVVRRMDRHFEGHTQTLKSLFRDEQRRILDRILASTVNDAVAVHRRLYRQNAPLIRFLCDLDAPLPPPLRGTAELVFNDELRSAFLEEDPDPEGVRHAIEEMLSEDLSITRTNLQRPAERWIGRLAEALMEQPADLERVQRMLQGVKLLRELPLEVSLNTPVELYYGLLQKSRKGEKPDLGGLEPEEAERWIAEIARLGEALGFRISPEDWAPAAAG